jgi:hypothetical protein
VGPVTGLDSASEAGVSVASCDAAGGRSSSSAGSLLASTGGAARPAHLCVAGSSATASPLGLPGAAGALGPAAACEEQQGSGQVGQLVPTPHGCTTRFTLKSIFTPNSKKRSGSGGKKKSPRRK